MTDIFLSYKAEDRARVKPLVDALTAQGLSVWWDVHIEGGAAWRETIRSHLDGAACVIVVWSEASVGPGGHFVQDEASRARRRGVYLPVVIDPVDPPLGFGQEHSLKLVGWRGSRRDPRFTDVLATVRAMIAGGPRPAPTARARAVRGGGRAPWLAGAGAVVGVAAALALAVFGGPAKAPANSVAVLPLANFSADPAQDYFSDGLTEELITSLSRVGGLQVAGRTSSFKFKASKEDSKAIGDKLGVNYLIDGSVRRSGQVVRVSAQLVDAPSGFERWSQTYDRELKDIFAVQSGIAQAVADALKVRLLGGDIAALSRGGTTSPEAYDAYLRGRRLFDAGGAEEVYRDAQARFDAAIAADPGFAAAHAARARTLLALAGGFVPPDKMHETLDTALASARRAVELAPTLAQAQAALGEVLYRIGADPSAAKQAYERALALGGGDADILTLYGDFGSQTGALAQAVTAVRRAATLDPLNPRVFRTMGYVMTAAHLYPESVTAFRRALELSPAAPGAHAAIGDAPGARAALAALIADRSAESFYQQAQVFAQWGDADRAFAALDDAVRAGDSGLVLLGADPLMAPLRDDPRYARFVARLAGRRGA